MNFAFRSATFIAVVFSSVATTAISATAQSSSSSCDSGYHCTTETGRHARFRHGHRYPAYGYGFRPVGYDHRYGTAELLRASAVANVLNANARSQHARAARLEMQNSIQFLATRLERKGINNESRFGHLHARGELVRAQKDALLASEQDLPLRPIVDPTSGRVAWPLLLRSSYYAKARGPIDQVFHQRSVVGAINPDHFLPMRDWIEQIECELKANVAYYELTDYLEAKSFLRNLVDEARQDVPFQDASTKLASH